MGSWVGATWDKGREILEWKRVTPRKKDVEERKRNGMYTVETSGITPAGSTR